MLTPWNCSWKFFETARRFVEAGGCDGIVPEAQNDPELWGDTLQKLGRARFRRPLTPLGLGLKLQILGADPRPASRI